MKFSLPALAGMLTALALGGCTDLGLTKPQWVSDDTAKGDLRTNLSMCVSQFDPAHLQDLDNNHAYDVTGPFVSQSRVAPVVDCMKSHGWTLAEDK